MCPLAFGCDGERGGGRSARGASPEFERTSGSGKACPFSSVHRRALQISEAGFCAPRPRRRKVAMGQVLWASPLPFFSVAQAWTGGLCPPGPEGGSWATWPKPAHVAWALFSFFPFLFFSFLFVFLFCFNSNLNLNSNLNCVSIPTQTGASHICFWGSLSY